MAAALKISSLTFSDSRAIGFMLGSNRVRQGWRTFGAQQHSTALQEGTHLSKSIAATLLLHSAQHHVCDITALLIQENEAMHCSMVYHQRRRRGHLEPSAVCFHSAPPPPTHTLLQQHIHKHTWIHADVCVKNLKMWTTEHSFTSLSLWLAELRFFVYLREGCLGMAGCHWQPSLYRFESLPHFS